MLVDIPQDLLFTGLQAVSRAVSAHHPLPILSGIHLSAHSRGLTLRSSCISMAIQVDIPLDEPSVRVYRTGSMVIPARYFNEMIRRLPRNIVTLETVSNLVLAVRSGKTVCRLCGMDPDLFPSMPEADEHVNGIRLPARLFHSMIQQVAFAVSTSEARPILTGISCHIAGNRLTISASDGIRLASKEVEIQNCGVSNTHIVIPGKNMLEMTKIAADTSDMIRIAIASDQIWVTTQNLRLQSMLIEGTYPSVDRIVPKHFTTRMTVYAADLLRAIERVTLLAENHVVRLETSARNALTLISYTSELGDVLDEIPVSHMDGAEFSISLNGKYMLDIVRHIRHDQVRLGFSGERSPIVIQPPENSPSSFYLITPVRSHHEPEASKYAASRLRRSN